MIICLPIFTISIYSLSKGKLFLILSNLRTYLFIIYLPKKKWVDIHGASVYFSVSKTASTTRHNAQNTPAKYASLESQHINTSSIGYSTRMSEGRNMIGRWVIADISMIGVVKRVTDTLHRHFYCFYTICLIKKLFLNKFMYIYDCYIVAFVAIQCNDNFSMSHWWEHSSHLTSDTITFWPISTWHTFFVSRH